MDRRIGKKIFFVVLMAILIGLFLTSGVTFANGIVDPKVTTKPKETWQKTSTTLTGGGSVVSDGNATVVQRGVCWNINGMPMLQAVGASDDIDKCTNDGAGLGNFTSHISGLNGEQTYYVRAYAKNDAGKIGYGEQILLSTVTQPTVSTTEVSKITSTTAASGGNVIDDGGSLVTARGVCWSSMNNPPTLSVDKFSTDGSGLGIFSSSITGMTPDKTYYLRAYAINKDNPDRPGYGDVIVFRTFQIVEKGNFNGDDKVDLQDAILALKVLSGMNTAGVTIRLDADTNGDDKVGIEDVIYILRKVLGL